MTEQQEPRCNECGYAAHYDGYCPRVGRMEPCPCCGWNEARRCACTLTPPRWLLDKWFANELHDFKMLCNHLSETYMYFSDGLISKPNTLPREVIAIAEHAESKRIDEAVAEALAEAKQREEDEYGKSAALRARVEQLEEAIFVAAARVDEDPSLAVVLFKKLAKAAEHKEGPPDERAAALRTDTV